MNDTYTFFIHTFFIHTYILYNDTFFIYHSWYTSNFETAYKKPPFYHGNYFFSDVVLVSNYHGCKGETIKLIPYYMVDIIYKTVKPSHLKKLQIIQNIKNLMSQLIFIFSD